MNYKKCNGCTHIKVCEHWYNAIFGSDTLYPEDATECEHFKTENHGEWIPIINYFHGKPDGRYYCSVCHQVETIKGIYCRLCGALMDGGSKNDC